MLGDPGAVQDSVSDALAASMPALSIVLCVAAASGGAVLCLFGGRFAKPMLAVLGITVGALGALAAVYLRGRGAEGAAAYWVLGGGVAGLAAAWLLFRVWMGIGMGLVLAAAMVIGVLVWRHAASPLTPARAEAAVSELAEAVRGADAEAAPAMVEKAAHEQARVARSWWSTLGVGTRVWGWTAAVGGALVGLVVGWIKPRLAASVQTSLIGSALMVLAAVPLVARFAPEYERWTPRGPVSSLGAVGLITALGVAVQWTLSPRRADMRGVQQLAMLARAARRC